MTISEMAGSPSFQNNHPAATKSHDGVILGLAIFNTVLSLVPICLHLMGMRVLYVLYHHNTGPLTPNAKLHLMHLSGVEIFFCLAQDVLVNMKVHMPNTT